ncbi:hypothetical protein [Nocardia altamirensis]|uniref:hypothetical protein n=1 Tax=Nocardia altamirensis TaxID=472158 RepID=UPI00114CA68A|nr:hypothetical protein [Nocardia altamirensis]
MAAEAHYFPHASPRLTVAADDPLTAHTSAAIALALASATALFGRHRLEPGKRLSLRHISVCDLKALVPLAFTSHTLVFGLPTQVPDANDEPLDDTELSPSQVEQAARELCQTLPSSHSDDLAIDAILSLPFSQRVAIGQVVNALAETNRSLTLELRGTVGPESSVLSYEQAELLHTCLLDLNRHTEIVTATGILDDRRTVRRNFYLERPDGDIHGSVDEPILAQLPALIRQRVTVRLEQSMSASGSDGFRIAYRLLAVGSADPELESPPR